MNKVTITIDGEPVIAESGRNLLGEALSCGFDIPHLCYDPRLAPFGACRLCFVEVKGKDKPIPACSLTIEEGLEIVTKSDNLRELRKLGLELFMAEHCGDCVAPCTLACPAGVDIQGFIAFINNGELARAANLIRETMPLPSICGRVCPRFCEAECRRSLVDEPVDICGLKRFAGDNWLEQFSGLQPEVSSQSNFKIAIIGGGPAGLTAAYYLALKGHKVTIYDAGTELGGMLRYGIPEYRLPKQILDQEINVITSLCQEVKLEQVLGRDFSLEELKVNYNAIFLGIGCQEAQTIGIPNEELLGIYSGIEFLRQVTLGNPPVIGQQVAVIGGGNTAMDAARTALRLGAKDVNVMYRRTREEMPAEPIEIEEAMEEGVKFNFLTNPKAFIGDSQVNQVQCIKMELGPPDESGRRRPVEILGSEYIVPVDAVIMAIGQKVESSIHAKLGLEVTSWGTVVVDKDSGQASIPGIFVAGDCVSGAATVVQAVAEAGKVARSIDLYLQGKSQPTQTMINSSTGSLAEQDLQAFHDIPKQARVKTKYLDVEERIASFTEYSPGFIESEAKAEASRCLECGCLDVHSCVLRELASKYQVDLELLGQSEQHYAIDHSHPFIERDQNKCVLCGKCVLLCKEINGTSAIGFVHRGYDTVIQYAPGLSREEICQSCGQCISACPTGALSIKLPWVKRGPWEVERVIETTCLQCNIGCALELHVVGDKIVLATSPVSHMVSEGALCKKGSFDYDSVYSNRILNPLVKQGNNHVAVCWEQALDVASNRFNLIKEQYGASSIAVLASPRLTNEEHYLVHKLTRLGLETNNLASTKATISSHQLHNAGLQDIVDSDQVIILDKDIKSRYPVLTNRLKKCVQKGGRISVIDDFAEILENMNQLKGHNKVIIITESERLSEAETKLLHQIINSGKSQFKLLLLCQDGNCKGQLVMGVHHQFLPGLRMNTKSQDRHFFANYYHQILPVEPGYDRATIFEKLQSGTLKGLVIIGDDITSDLNVHPEVFTLAISTNWQENLKGASVILPAASFIESNGTSINIEGRLQKIHAMSKPKALKENWEILVLLINALGYEYQLTELNDLVKEIIFIIDPMLVQQQELIRSKLLGS